MAANTSTTGADIGSVMTRSTTTPSNHKHRSTICLTGLSKYHSPHHMDAALANTCKHQLRTENSIGEVSVAASIARMTAILQEFNRVMIG